MHYRRTQDFVNERGRLQSLFRGAHRVGDPQVSPNILSSIFGITRGNFSNQLRRNRRRETAVPPPSEKLRCVIASNNFGVSCKLQAVDAGVYMRQVYHTEPRPGGSLALKVSQLQVMLYLAASLNFRMKLHVQFMRVYRPSIDTIYLDFTKAFD